MSKGRRALFLALLTAGLVTACGDKGAPAGAGRKVGRSLAVRTAPVVSRDVVYKVQALGSLEPEELVQITAEVNGAVKEVLFNAGDTVTADTVLARIDPDRYRLEAERAEAAHRRSVADWKRAESDLARREALAREKLVAEEELNRARQETERLAADAASAKAVGRDRASRTSGARSCVRRAAARSIRARSTRAVRPGRQRPGDARRPPAAAAPLQGLRIRVAEGRGRARRSPSASPLSAEPGSRRAVYHVSGIADPATRQVEVLAWVDNPGVLKPGFFAEVALSTATHRGAVVVAEGAVQATERGFVVYVVENGNRARSGR